MEATRSGYGHGLVAAGKADKNVVALCCDLTDSTKTNFFEVEFPSRFVEVGVAEQNLAGLGAGMAMVGKIPFIASYATFSPGRNWDQVRVSICYQNLNVKIVGAHAGVSVGPDGATHQALEDIAITRVLPNLTVLAPADYEEAKKATIEAAKIKGPVYIRLARSASAIFTTQKSPFKIGRAEVLTQGTDVTVVASGPLVYQSLLAANEIKKEVSVEVINCHTIKPIDYKTIIKSTKKTGRVVTVEEHQLNGGLGGAVAEVLTRHYPAPQEFVAMPDRFGESGKPEQLLAKFGLDKDGIIKAVKRVLKR
ncbi:MAG: transketolase [Candidatus Buchananbacteria bacterium CG10_big_fil_rev_8_21_14_0_10_42_9]|uniref:Transketolase n=1 Tax=Candidatus Buchananbacteria bacterium CG10_big_fil_rev_8_21_14_0_10_42_9 TaxID=1974526 RepID=A0A2H0W1W4_9BACT|nr:MAG: transketolase [Candidatus Buchananbacteria bacterium CG10_big_fil_rev_8_21_14_0_10_42_9]